MAMTWTSRIPCAEAMVYRSDWTSLTSKPASISASPAMDISHSTSASVAGRSVTVSSGLGGDPETVVSSRSSSPTRIKTTKAMIAEVSGTVALMLAGGVEGIVTTGVAVADGRGLGEAVGDGVGRVVVGADEVSGGVGLASPDEVARVGSGDGGSVGRTLGLSGVVGSEVGDPGEVVPDAAGEAAGLAGLGVSAAAPVAPTSAPADIRAIRAMVSISRRSTTIRLQSMSGTSSRASA